MRKGSILIVVLILVSFLSSVVILMFEKSTDTGAELVEIQAENQGAIYAATAIEALKALIKFDNADYDWSGDDLFNIPPVDIGNGRLIITMKPVDDRISVNGLRLKDKERERVLNALEKIFQSNEIDIEILHNLQNWVKNTDSSTFDNVMNQDGNSYYPKHGAMETFAEIRLIDDVPKVYGTLVQYLSIGNRPKININMASADVIEALIPELSSFINDIITRRTEEPFKRMDEITKMVNNPQVSAEIVRFFDVKSTMYYMKLEMHILENVTYYHLLLDRNADRIKVVRYIEGTGLDYF